MNDDNGPAFPSTSRDGRGWEISYEGMNLRDYFAGQALAGIISDPNVTTDNGKLAKACYGYADAMLKARKQQ